jgi:hypothetical protein
VGLGLLRLDRHRQADRLAGERHGLEAQPAVPARPADVPDGVRVVLDPFAAQALLEIAKSAVGLMLDRHSAGLDRLERTELAPAADQALPCEGVAGEKHVKRQRLAELEACLPAVRLPVNQVVKWVLGGRGPAANAEVHLPGHLGDAFGDDLAAREDRRHLQRRLPVDDRSTARDAAAAEEMLEVAARHFELGARAACGQPTE